jgi:hypothetical protein
MPKDPFIREKFTKLRTAARKLAVEYFERYPKVRYLTEVEGWRHLQAENIEFTINGYANRSTPIIIAVEPSAGL